jgi:hypothetical protein
MESGSSYRYLHARIHGNSAHQQCSGGASDGCPATGTDRYLHVRIHSNFARHQRSGGASDGCPETRTDNRADIAADRCAGCCPRDLTTAIVADEISNPCRHGRLERGQRARYGPQ